MKPMLRACLLVLALLPALLPGVALPARADEEPPTNVVYIPAASKPRPVLAVDAGSSHTCALTSAGGVKCWGYGYGNTPVDAAGLTSGVAAVTNFCALTTGSGVKCWAWNGNGELGNGTTISSTVYVDIVGLTSGVVAISTGLSHACALTSAGGVKCWGWNNYGQLGDGSSGVECGDEGVCRLTPVDVAGLSGVVAISAGGWHTCALLSTGAVRCWGRNAYGELGDGTIIDRSTPIDVAGLTSGVSTISAGWGHTCALTNDGVKCWGWNDYGQMGDGTRGNRTTPVPVPGLESDVVAIDAGMYHNCALTNDGVKCWGLNDHGQLGDGGGGVDCGYRNQGVCRLTPVDVVGLGNP